MSTATAFTGVNGIPGNSSLCGAIRLKPEV